MVNFVKKRLNEPRQTEAMSMASPHATMRCIWQYPVASEYTKARAMHAQSAGPAYRKSPSIDIFGTDAPSATSTCVSGEIFAGEIEPGIFDRRL